MKKFTKFLSLTFLCSVVTTGCFFYAQNERLFAVSDENEQIHVTQATVIEEVVSKRTKFTKDFLMSDGSHLGAVYSMPVGYKKNGVWKEVDTTLLSREKFYQTKPTD